MWRPIDYTAEYLEEMLAMVKENYGDVDIANEDFLKWQYFDNPAGRAIIKLAYDEANNEIAGQHIAIPLMFKLFDQQVTCVYSLDILTREKYRGQKIFKDLTSIAYKEANNLKHSFVVIFPNENSRPGFLKYFDFKSVCRFPVLVSPVKVVHSNRSKSASSIIKITNQNIALLDGLWAENKDKYQIINIRDSKYLKWRYLDIPKREYKFFGLMKENKLVGYIVGTIKKISGFQTGVITDMQLSRDCSKKDGTDLINALIQYFDNNSVKISMAFFPEHSEEYKHLKSNFYFRWPRKLEPRTFEVYGLDIEGSNQLKIRDGYSKENWFTSIGDYLLV